MSTHSVDVICINEILSHPNADKLEIVKIYEFTCCVRKGDWKVGDLAAYIEPDYVVDVTRPEFSFLRRKETRDKERIKPKRLRGIMSQGLLVPAPEGSKEGDNVIEQLGVERYEPPVNSSPSRPGYIKSSNAIKGPEGYFPKYDLENWRKYSRLLESGEQVYVTEKIHGANAKFKFHDGEMYCGSRTRWVANDGENSWSIALRQNPWLEAFCEEHPDLTVYGEIYGWVQDLRYGHEQGQISFRVFDLLRGNTWLDANDIWSKFLRNEIEDINEGQHLLGVPLIVIDEYSKDLINQFVDGQTTIPGADHVREGIVIKPAVERQDMRLGRVALKCVSNEYLERA